MNAIQQIPCSQRIRRAWEKVFQSNDPFRDCFSARVDARLLFYPTYGYHFTEQQYAAFIHAAQEMGKAGFYVSVVEYAGDFLSRGQHWSCAFPTYNEYRDIPLVLENSVYLPDGTFGAIVSHEDHALVGGTRELIERTSKHYPLWQEDRRTLEREWEAGLAKAVLDAAGRSCE